MTTDPQRREALDAFYRLTNHFDLLGSLIGNGCEHGFKPAKSCQNKGCEDAQAQHYYEEIIVALTPPPVESEVAPELKETLEMVKRHLDRKISPLEYSRTTIKLLYDAAQAPPAVAATIRSDNTETLNNALQRIRELEEAAEGMVEALRCITDQLERIGDSRKDAPFIEASREALAAYNIAKGGKS